MRFTIPLLALMATASAAVAGGTQTVTVNFDDQQGGFPPVVTDGLFSPYATFSTTQDSVLLIFNNSSFVGGTDPNNLSAATSPAGPSFDSDIYIDFNLAVQNLSFNILADNDVGLIALLNVHHGGGLEVVEVIGNGNFNDAVALDLSAYADVTRVELVNVTDEFGLSIDDLVFDYPVPAPATAALLALAGAANTRRRRA